MIHIGSFRLSAEHSTYLTSFSFLAKNLPSSKLIGLSNVFSSPLKSILVPTSKNEIIKQINTRKNFILDRLIFKKRDYSANLAKLKLGLQMSSRTIQRYLNRLGWVKIKTRFCQVINHVQRIHRFMFAIYCLNTFERFLYSIFIDECTVALDKNSRTQWYRKVPGETRLGFKGKFKHAASVHIIGGISRRGPTKLMIFTGNLNANGVMLLFDEL